MFSPGDSIGKDGERKIVIRQPEILEEGTAVGKRVEDQAEFIDGSCLKKGSVNDAASGEKNPFNAKQLFRSFLYTSCAVLVFFSKGHHVFYGFLGSDNLVILIDIN